MLNINILSFDQIVKYDSNFFPVPRPQFLKYWIKEPESLAIAILKNENIIGYGMIRKSNTDYRIGPLFSDNKIIAENIFKKLNNFAVGSQVFLDVPDVNKEALELANKYNMKPMFETARMYTKKPPAINLNKIFGITTFEVG